MRIQIEIPDDVAAALFASTQARSISTDTYVSELVSQALSNAQLADLAKNLQSCRLAASHPEGREDMFAGRVVSHEDVVAWHKSHPE